MELQEALTRAREMTAKNAKDYGIVYAVVKFPQSGTYGVMDHLSAKFKGYEIVEVFRPEEFEFGGMK